jgi:hypothetical protein
MIQHDLLRCVDELPPEVLLMVFSHFDIYELVALLRVCKKWNDILVNNGTLWPSSVHILSHENFYSVGRVPCEDAQAVSRLCESLSRLPGTITSAELNFILQEGTQELSCFLDNFTFLRELTLHLGAICNDDLAYVLNSIPTLRCLNVQARKTIRGSDLILRQPTTLRELSIHMPDNRLIISLVANSPDLNTLLIPRNVASNELTGRFGQNLEFLYLSLKDALPRIVCKSLKALHLRVGHVFTNGDSGDLSHVRHLMLEIPIHSIANCVTVMDYYNIGRNVECLTVSSRVLKLNGLWRDICCRTPNLKALTILPWNNGLAGTDVKEILDCCKGLQIVYCSGICVTNDAKEELHARNITLSSRHWYRSIDSGICQMCLSINAEVKIRGHELLEKYF